MSNSGGKSNIFVRIAVIAGMLIILFFIAAAIVKFVPRIISAMNPANVSLTSLFNPAPGATTTPETGIQSTPQAPTPSPATTTPPQTSPSRPAQPSQPTQPSGSTGSQSYVYTYRPTGPADLSISLIKVGQISGDGSFIQTSSIQPGARVQMQFTVANVGSGRSGNWNLQAVLPSSIANERLYTSITEPALNPGDSYLMTLAFDSYDPNQGSIQISISPSDSNATNNVLVVPLTGSATNYNNTGCYWSNGYQYCNNNYNNYNYNNNCYWYNGQYYCNNTNYNNSGQSVCYGANNIAYYCNNNSGNSCYWSNNQYYCNTGGSGSASDLSITITNVGIMDRNTGQFYYANSFRRSDKVAVQFEVKNLGGQYSSGWTFTGSLPSNTSGSYNSSTQNALAPGQTMNFTLGFDYPNGGTQTLSLQLYPQGSDTNSGNNYASRSIYVND